MSNLPKANKALGQHFLIDQDIIRKITMDFAERAKAIIEVGPGPGVLTKDLAAHKLPLHVVDKDERFPEYLKEFLSEESIHIEDALAFDFEAAFDLWSWSDLAPIWLVSNLPYNVSTPLLVKFLQVEKISLMTLMFQREVADKAFPIDTRKGKAMNSLMALCQTFFAVELLCKVPPGAFDPPPKVDSAVLSFERLENTVIPLQQFKAFEKYLRKVFAQKRKQLGTVLKPHYKAELLANAFEENGILRTVRAESLELSDIQNLFKSLHPQDS
jgi:16S rRNA (adenine1518-N6/adenine1519-N6)-dimethyltransferase